MVKKGKIGEYYVCLTALPHKPTDDTTFLRDLLNKMA